MALETTAIAAAAGLAEAPALEAIPLVTKMLNKYGLSAVLVVAFIGWSYQREAGLNQRINADVEFERKDMTTAINNCTTALQSQTSSNDSLKQLINKLFEDRK
jgi:hypothetical protein